MIKTILIIIISVTFFGVLFFILVRNALRKKLDILIEKEERKKLEKIKEENNSLRKKMLQMNQEKNLFKLKKI